MAWEWWLISFAFLTPLGEAGLLVIGEWWLHTGFKVDASKFKRLIIQVTTAGREQDRVNEIIAELRAMALSMHHEIWVVTEPGMGDVYPDADRVVTVDRSFECLAEYKARALEYSRLLRQSLHFNGPDTKILLLDDDTTPTRKYVETAFVADYDVCQGITAPRIQYGGLPFRHFLLSHMDDLRLLSCWIYCSFFQGVIGRPLYVHGEGLCMTGAAEEAVTWNYKIFASEDLVFGTNAAARGMRWGFFHEYIQLTSPWTWSAYLTQRQRWLWGNIHALTHRGIMPPVAATMIGAKYVVGFCTFVASITGVVLIASQRVSVPPAAYVIFWAAFISWTGAFAVSGWINAGREGGVAAPHRARYYAFRVWQAMMAVVLCPLTVIWTMAALFIVLFKGNPRRFNVIAKTSVPRKPKPRPLPGVRPMPTLTPAVTAIPAVRANPSATTAAGAP